jgi:hypothetical protein
MDSTKFNQPGITQKTPAPKLNMKAVAKVANVKGHQAPRGVKGVSARDFSAGE